MYVAKMFFGLKDPVSLGLDLLDLFLVEDDVLKNLNAAFYPKNVT